MGADGGCVPQRCDMIKTKGYVLAPEMTYCGGLAANANTLVKLQNDVTDKQMKLENRQFYSKHCFLTREPLKTRVVVCSKGYLYNKEALLTALVEKTMPRFLKHIRGLKHVRDCEMTFVDGVLVCPITGDNLEHGGHKIVCEWREKQGSKAQVYSERGYKSTEKDKESTETKLVELFQVHEFTSKKRKRDEPKAEVTIPIGKMDEKYQKILDNKFRDLDEEMAELRERSYGDEISKEILEKMFVKEDHDYSSERGIRPVVGLGAKSLESIEF